MFFGVMERHNGHIDVRSALDAGMTICLAFATTTAQTNGAVEEPVEAARD